MTVLRVPYHLDEYLPDLDLPLGPAQIGLAQTITAELPPGDTWARLTALYRRVADAVARAPAGGSRPVVLSGDCTTALGTVAGLQRGRPGPGDRLVRRARGRADPGDDGLRLPGRPGTRRTTIRPRP